jgi:hypothetical protein
LPFPLPFPLPAPAPPLPLPVPVLAPLPPGDTPPLGPVEEVPAPVELVAVELLVEVGVELLDELVVELELVDELDGVVVVVVLVLVEVLELLVGVLLLDVVLVAQSLPASCAIVLASWLRLASSEELTDDGRPATRLPNAAASLAAVPHCPAFTAEEILSSWPCSVPA